MLKKIYRIGASNQAIEKTFLVSQLSRDKLETFAKETDGFSISTEPGTGTATISVASGLRWLGDFDSRQRLFDKFAAVQSDLAALVKKSGGILHPTSISLGTASASTQGQADAYRFLCADETEQAIFCQVLREAVPMFIVAFGRAAISDAGLEGPHSSRILSGLVSAARNWPNTSREHLNRMEKFYRVELGLTSLAHLEIRPGIDERGAPFVETTALDGQVWLSTTRAASIILQALFLRARRLARDGKASSWTKQETFERNRSRAAAEGPYSLLDPSGKAGNRLWLELLLNLRQEFRVLETRYEEIECVILGAFLNLLGHPAPQSENDILRMRLAAAQKTGRPVSQVLSELLSDARATPLQDDNRLRHGEVANDLQQWWGEWLSSDRPLPDLLPKEQLAHRPKAKMPNDLRQLTPNQRPAIQNPHSPSSNQVRPNGNTARREGERRPDNHRPQASTEFQRFVEKWKAIGDQAQQPERVALLAQFSTLQRDLGYFVSKLDDENKKTIRRALQGIGKARWTVAKNEAIGTSSALRNAQERTQKNNAVMLTVQLPAGEETPVLAKAKEAELRKALPSDVYAFTLMRFTKGDTPYLEFLLINNVAEIAYGQ